ncbi:MAG: acyl carrier protein [Alphaproteobacteria bacterium]|nr:acyl carrier protein [Alphaproteobacteria bacterium]
MRERAAPALDKTVIETRIVEFLASQSIIVDPGEDVSGIELLESGRLDSLVVMQLTLFLGQTFDVEIEDEDFVAENFATVGTLANLILRKCRS